MTYMQALLGFAVLAGAMAMVPGLDMVMTMNEAIHYGRRNGIMAGFGIQCGVLVWAVPCLEAQPSSTWCEATPPDGRSRPRL